MLASFEQLKQKLPQRDVRIHRAAAAAAASQHAEDCGRGGGRGGGS